MATAQHTVLIEFKADYSSLESAIDVLAKAGKVDATVATEFKKANVEIKKQGDEMAVTAKKAQASTQSFGRLSELLKQYPKSGVNRFLLQVGNELSAAGLKAKDFYQKLDPKEVTPKVASLRNELKQVKEQMQQAALAGGVLSEEYKKLKQRAGELDDTIKDVNSDIANAGSDTRGIDNVVGSISALAGGYSAVQGAAALFGDESEDLQKALLKVNAAMALATGIQQVLNAVQKEGALARVADTVATGAQIAVQKIYTFVTGRATAATLAFKVALASTGIGLVVVGAIALANAFNRASKKTKDLTKDLEALANANAGAVRSLNRAQEQAVALAEKQGKVGSEVSKINIKFLEDEIKKNRELETQQRQVINDASKGNKVKKEAADALNKTFEDGLALKSRLSVAEINLDKQIADEKKDAAEKSSEAATAVNEKALENAKRLRALEFADYQAGIELKLLAAEKGSSEELDLQKSLLRAKLQIDLEGENLSINQRKLLIQQFFKDRLELEKTFNKAVVAAAVEDQKNRDAAALENLNLTEEERLSVKIEYLQLGAAQEITAAEGNAAKILAINAKLNSDITAAKVESLKKQADYEIAFQSAQGGGSRRALESVAANEKLKGDIRINAIIQLAQREQQVLDRQIKANRDAAQVQGSDQQALALEYAQLLDEKVAKTEAAENKISDIMDRERQERLLKDQAYINVTVESLRTLTGILETIQQQNQEASDQAFKRKREEIEELLEAGAITEREARERNRRIDLQERQAKQRAAQQQKNLAVFNALLAIPQAYMQGLLAPPPLGGPFYAAVLAGLAAAQAAAIAARPIPKFATGKKGSYQGLGEVGEAGAELIQRADGSMEVATRRSMVYLGSRDKVFTAAETKNILPFVNKEAMAASNKGDSFDYEKLAKAVKQKQGGGTVVNIDKEFISESVANGLSRVNYFDRYYNSRG